MLKSGITASRMVRAILLVLAMGPLVAVAGDQDFIVHNATGVDIYELYVSPGSTAEWEEDVLDVDVLEDGDSVEIAFHPSEDAELWDLQVRDSEGNTLTWTALNLLEISELTLHYEDGNAWAEAE